MTPSDPQPQSPEQIAPTPVCDANGFTVWTKEFGNVDVLNLDDAKSLEARALKAEAALTAANAATSAMREERDQEKVRCSQLIQGKVTDDATHSKVLAEISHRQARELGELRADCDSWQRRAQESEARAKELEAERDFFRKERDELIQQVPLSCELPPQYVSYSKLSAAWGRTIDRIPGLGRKESVGGFDELAEHLGIRKTIDGISDEYCLTLKADLSAAAKHEAEVASLREGKQRLGNAFDHLRGILCDVYNRAQRELRTARGHHCDFETALQSCKDLAEGGLKIASNTHAVLAARNTASEPQQP